MRLVIIPVYNEAKHIRKILIDIASLDINADILLINDGSTDETEQILNEMKIKNVIVHKTNQGYGKSIIDGLKFAIKNDYSYIVTIDGDGQHELKCLPRFFAEIKRFNIVSGSRYLPDSTWINKPPYERLRVNKMITEIMRKCTGYSITDSFCGFKGYQREAIEKLNLTEWGYGVVLQILIQTWHFGLTFKEIPIPLIYNDYLRNFKGIFDSTKQRIEYYLKIIRSENS